MLKPEFKDVSVSHATFRTDDLIEAFGDFLKSLTEKDWDPRANDYYLAEEDRKNVLSYVDWEDVSEIPENQKPYILEELFDILNSIAPEGTYFGGHPGNGSDFGFWEISLWEISLWEIILWEIILWEISLWEISLWEMEE